MAAREFPLAKGAQAAGYVSDDGADDDDSDDDDGDDAGSSSRLYTPAARAVIPNR